MRNGGWRGGWLAALCAVSVGAAGAAVQAAGEPPADGEYRLVNECSNKVLEVRGGRTKRLVNLRLWSWGGELHQKWRLETLTDGSRRLVAMHSGLVMDAAFGDRVDGVSVFQQREWRGFDNQRLLIDDGGDGWTRIRVKQNEAALTVRDGSIEDGAVVWQKPWDGSCGQRWRFEALNDIGTPVEIRAVAGDGQKAPVGARLRVAPSVEVVDSKGRPVPDMPVRFDVLSGGGRVTGGVVSSDASGVATVGGAWWLGPIPGTQKMVASTSGLPEVVFTATATPIAGTGTLDPLPGSDAQTGAAGAPLGVTPGVVVRSAATGQPVPGVSVSFAVVAGGGRVLASQVFSGLDGVATPGAWMLGDTLGLQTLEVTATGYGAVQFTATALPADVPRVERQVLMTDVYEVWGMAFAPDGALLFTERGRGLSVRLRDGTVRRLFAPADFINESNSGMLGVALDPAFAENRRVYVYMASSLSGVRDNRVVRFVVNSAYTQIKNREDIVTGISYQRGTLESGHHSGGQIAFGRDGHLYISTGDTRTGIVPQSPLELGGKVLRVDTKGFPVADNGAPAGADPRIYMMGIRNAQGIALHPGELGMFLLEHGTGRDDEITRMAPGSNGGWDPRPRPLGSSSATCPNGRVLEYCGYENTRMTNYAWYPGAQPPIWSSGVPAKGLAGGTFVTGAAWRSWNGALAAAQLSGRRLVMMELAPDGNSVVRATPLLESYGLRIRSVVQGPDGALYVATSSDGNRSDRPTEVWRLVPR